MAGTAPGRGRLRERGLPLLAVVLAAVAAHASSLAAGFVYDDYLQILENLWLRDPRRLPEVFSTHVWGFTGWMGISNFYRPLMHALNLVTYQACGPRASCFHATSVLLHAANSALLFLLARRLLAKTGPPGADHPRGAPFAAALLFAVYPASSQAVAWLGSSADLIYSFFVIATLLAHLRADPERPALLPALAFLGALLAKETALVTPALVLVLDLATRRLSRRTGLRTAALRYAPLLVTLVLYIALRVAVLGALLPVPRVTSGTAGTGLPLLDALKALLWYLRHLLLPLRHNFFPALPPVRELLGTEGLLLVLFGAALLLGVATLARTGRHWWVPLSILFLPLLPALGAGSALQYRMAERYLYLPVAGYCLLVGVALGRPLERLRASGRSWWFPGIAVLGILAVLTGFSDAAFRDEIALWREAVRAAPDLPAARAYLATALFRAGRLEEGVAEAREAARLDSSMQYNWHDLGEALRRLGRPAEAAEAFEEVLRISPDDVESLAKAGRLHIAGGQLDRGVTRLEQGVRLAPGDAALRLDLGLAYELQGSRAKAVREVLAARAIDPTLPGVAEALQRLRPPGPSPSPDGADRRGDPLPTPPATPRRAVPGGMRR